MNPRFSPLLKPSAESSSSQQSFKLKIMPSEDVTTPFQTLASAVRASGGGKGGRSRDDADHEHQPTIDLKREGDTITRIVVTCGCGSVMEIDCDYAG